MNQEHVGLDEADVVDIDRFTEIDDFINEFLNLQKFVDCEFRNVLVSHEDGKGSCSHLTLKKKKYT
jgi:hypothetical protein